HEIVLQADRLRRGDQESCAYTGQKDHDIETACGSLPDEFFEFIAIFDRSFLEQRACVNGCSKPLQKRRELLREAMLQNGYREMFKRPCHLIQEFIKKPEAEPPPTRCMMH